MLVYSRAQFGGTRVGIYPILTFSLRPIRQAWPDRKRMHFSEHNIMPDQVSISQAGENAVLQTRSHARLVFMPQPARKEAAQFFKKVSSNVPGLHVVDADIPLENLLNDDQKLDHIALGREFHISLGRTVPIRVHQIDSMVTMLRQKLQIQKQYWIDFNKWEIFVNDDYTRAFLSLEVTTGGLPEITKQIQAVNEAYRLHNLPEFYKDPRPHISLAWASGDTSDLLRRVVEEMKKSGGIPLQNRVFTVKFSSIECKIGSKTYKICKLPG